MALKGFDEILSLEYQGFGETRESNEPRSFRRIRMKFPISAQIWQCAHLCAVLEIPAFVRDSGRIAAWNRLPEDLRQRLASLPPEVLAALQALFGGAPRQP